MLANLGAADQYQQIVPVTPEAAALTKIVNYPVDLNTGVPNINIPFHEIKTGGLVLPIGINYHAGGFKINEQATRVGLGWTLNCELQITRMVNGLDDFSPTGYYNNSKLKSYYTSNPGANGYPFKITTSDFISREEYLLATGAVDGQPDKFSYQLLNKAGSFYFQKDDVGNVVDIVPVPYDNIKIKYENGQFIITDTDGAVYYFGETGAGSLSDRHLRGIEYTEGTQYPGNTIRTAWKCKKIENVTKTAQIGFEYVLRPQTLYKKATDFIEYYHSMEINFEWPSATDCALNLFRGDKVPASTYDEYYSLLANLPFYALSSPKYMENFGDGQKKFHLPYLDNQNQLVDKVYSVNQGGFLPTSSILGISLSKITFEGGAVEFSGIERLTDIVVRDKFNNAVKTIVFNQSLTAPIYSQGAKMFNGENYAGTAYLDDVQVNGSDIYRFVYKNKVAFGNHLIGQDAWGYRNSKTTEVSGYPADYASNVPRQSDLVEKHMSRFPTSCTEISANYVFSVGGDQTAEVPDAEYMTFGTLHRIVYPTGGYTDFELEPNKYNEKVTIFNDDQPNKDAIPRVGGGLRVRCISYFDGINETVPAWRKVYKYGELQDGMGIALNKPAAIYDDLKRGFDAFSYEQYVGYITSQSNCSNSYGCLKLIATESKKTLTPASHLNYAYPNGAPIYYTKVTEYQQDFGASTGKKEYEYYRPGAFNLINGIPPLELMHTTSLIDGTNIPWQHTNGLMGMLKSESEYRYDSCELKLFHQKKYSYKPYIRSLQVRVAYSFLKTIYQVVSGPQPTASGGVYNDLATFSGALTPPEIYKSGEYGIPVGKLLLDQEEEKWFNGNSNMTISNSYSYDNNGYLQPSRITTVNSKGETIEKGLKYSYDFTSEPVCSTMVVKNMLSPVIEETIKNITNNRELSKTRNNYSTFSVGTGFIALSSVMKSYNGGALENEVTFDQYDQRVNPLQLTTRDQIVKSYVWAYDGQYPVSEIVGMTYADVNTIVNPGTSQPISGSYDEGDINGRISGLRSAANNNKVNVATFTYKPLIGLISKTDRNGRKEFYEYDNAGRLKTIRNNENQIVKQLEYSLAGNTASWHLNNNFYELPGNATAILPQACGPTSQRINISLQTYVPPGSMESPNTNLELYNGGFLMESGGFPVVSTSNIYTNQMNVPVGTTFDIRFVPSPYYTGPEIKYYYTTPADPNTFIRVSSGSIISFQVPVSGSYVFYADNTGTIIGQ